MDDDRVDAVQPDIDHQSATLKPNYPGWIHRIRREPTGPQFFDDVRRIKRRTVNRRPLRVNERVEKPRIRSKSHANVADNLRGHSLNNAMVLPKTVCQSAKHLGRRVLHGHLQ